MSLDRTIWALLATWLLLLCPVGCVDPGVAGTSGAAFLSTEGEVYYLHYHINGASWADHDNDGDLDVAVCDGNNGGPIKVWDNDGGALSLGWASDDDYVCKSVAWGDWDDDGDLDLAVGGHGPNRVFENAGGLGTTPAWSSDESINTWEVLWVDIDGDLDLDLVAGNPSAQPIHIYENTGASLATGADPAFFADTYLQYTMSLAAGDIDGDGDIDLFSGSSGGNQSYDFINDGAGTLTRGSYSSGEQLGTALGDMDGDGDLDIVAGRSTLNRVYENLYSEGGTYFQAFEDTVDEDSHDVAIGDIDLDGVLDFAIGTYGATIREASRVVFGDGSLGFEDPWTEPTSDGSHNVAIADVDGDGVVELLVTAVNTSDTLYSSENLGLHPAWQGPTGAVGGVDLGDWDGDGDLDLAVAQGDGLPLVVFQNNDGELAPWWTSTETDDSRDVAWADWDGDGDLDLAVANGPAQPDRVYENHAIHPVSVGAFLTLAWSSLDLATTDRLAWADVDGDGDLDLAMARGAGVSGGEADVVYTNDGGSMTLTWTSPALQETGGLAWGDWDCDGDPDLATGDLAGGLSEIYVNDGSGLSASPAWSGMLGSVGALAWGDVDGDGDPDLAVARGAGGAVPALFENTGDCAAPFIASTPTWQANGGTDSGLAFGDWDGDGDLDLATIDPGSGASSVYANDGSTLEISPRLAFADGEQTSCLDWGDLEPDGDLDLVVGAQGADGGPTLLLNHRTAPPRLPNDPTYAVMQPLTSTHRLGSGRGDPQVAIGDPVDGLVDVPVLLVDDEGDPVRSLLLEHSAVGSGQWMTATVVGPTTDLATSSDGVLHTLQWDLVADSVQGDEVSLRAVVQWQSPRQVTEPIQHGAIGAAPINARVYPECFPLDADGDGSPCTEDCDDLDPDRSPDLVELCDELDSDCDGDLVDGDADTDTDGAPDCIDEDDDGDGSLDGDDCAPLDATVHPAASDQADDGLDQDCNGVDTVSCFEDADGDGIGSASVVLESEDGDCTDDVGQSDDDTDCDDADPDNHPGGVELCDGQDNDCAGGDDYGGFDGSETDDDADGVSECEGDCDDADGDRFPGNPEICDDGLDNDCDPDTSELLDSDGDGATPCTGDCDDDDAEVAPDLPEVCDGKDNDCDPLTDEDGDGDGDGWSVCGGDCDDGDPQVYEGAPEVCDELDSDCDADLVDDFEDTDADGRPDCLDEPAVDPRRAFVMPPGCEVGCGAGVTTRGAPPSWTMALALVPLALLRRRRRRSISTAGPGGPPPLLLIGALAALLLPCTAAASEASDAAEEAFRTHQEHCATVAAGSEASAVESMIPVTQSWQRVLEAFDETGETFLLYWRGVLAECMGQDERAAGDLQLFVGLADQQEVLRAQVTDARGRLRRMGIRTPEVDAEALAEARARAEQTTEGSDEASPEALRAAARARTGRRLAIGLGGGYQRTATFDYGHLALDLSLGVVGPLRVEAGVRMALSGPPVNDYGEQDPTRRALLVTTVLGPVLAFDLPVRPRVGALLQLAPNPAGSAGPAVLVGVVGLAGAEIPLGASPLAVRLGAELGVLGPMFCLRVGAQVVLGLGRMQAKVKR